MKSFDTSYFFKLVAPLIYRILPMHPARRFWCLLIASALLVHLVNIVGSFWNGFLGNPKDDSPDYYCLIVVETIRYGGWLWGFWYGFYQLAKLSPANRLMTPQLLSCSVTGGLLMYFLTTVTQQVDADYTHLVQGMLILAFGICVLLPTLWQPTNTN